MYVNVFCAAVPKANKEAYIEHATTFCEVVMENGCLGYRETWASDVPDGETTSFLKAVKCGDDEAVVLGWAEWPDKETADAGMGKAMQDPRMQEMSMLFDGKRLIFGGFESIVEG